MDDETPEMEAMTLRMRQVMAAWVADPENTALKSEYQTLQKRYQRLFVEHKRGQLSNGIAG